MPAGAIRFKQQRVPRQNGELARLKVVQGPDQGVVFVVVGHRVTIGRGETNDVILMDLKSSRIHAEISSINGAWQCRDLGSSNGIFINSQKAQTAKIRSGDMISLGETTFEFQSAEAGTQILIAPGRSVDQIRVDQQMTAARKDQVKKEIGFGNIHGLMNVFQKNSSDISASSGSSGKRKKLLIVAVLVLGLLLLFEEEKPKKKTKGNVSTGNLGTQRSDSGAERNLASYLPQPENEQVRRTSTMLFKLGFREYREGNYLRAKSHFETVLQVDPGHRLATIYLENSKKEIDVEIKHHLMVGGRSFESGKMLDAKGHFESILRLLHYDRTNPSYKEAQDQLQKVEDRIRETGVM